jgi:hypothetical protein
VRISLNTNLDSIVAGDDISIVIHPDAWEIATTLYYRIETSQPVQHTIASVVSPFNLEYDWTVDVIGNPVVFQVSAFPVFHSAFSDPVLISPAAPELTAPTDGELMAAGSPYTFRWTQKPPKPSSYRLRFSTDNAQTFPELGNDFSGDVDHTTRNVPATPTSHGLVRLEGIFPQFDPIFDPPLHVTTTDRPILHVGTPAPWYVGEDGTVHWTTAGAVDHFKVELSRNGGQSWTTLADNVAGAQHHLTVGVDPPVSNSCRVRVEAFGPNGTATAVSGTFHIVGRPPRRGGRGPRD